MEEARDPAATEEASLEQEEASQTVDAPDESGARDEASPIAAATPEADQPTDDQDAALADDRSDAQEVETADVGAPSNIAGDSEEADEPAPEPFGEAVTPEPYADDTAPEIEPAGAPAPDEEGETEPVSPPDEEQIADLTPAAVDADVDPALAQEVEEALEGVEADVEAEEDEEPAEDTRGDWFVVHTYAGYENKVKADLETRVASMNMEELIYEVVIPMEEVMEIKGGKKQMVQRKVFPGYLLVRMELNDDSWYVVRNTPGVTGFVGSGNKPIPLSEREVDKILRRKAEAERPKPKLEWGVNDGVRVTTGPFANFQGVISEVDAERQKVKVLVNIFGRETPVELSFDQIAKV